MKRRLEKIPLGGTIFFRQVRLFVLSLLFWILAPALRGVLKSSMFRLRILFLIGLMMPPTVASRSLADIGVLLPTKSVHHYEAALKAFEAEMTRQGLVPDQHKLLTMAPEPTTVSWINSARRLTVLDVKILVVFGGAPAKAVLNVKRNFPTLYGMVYNPAALGVVGENVAGVPYHADIERLVLNLKKVSPFTRLAILYSSEEKDSELQAWAVSELKDKHAFEPVEWNVKKNSFNLPDSKVDAVFLTSASSINKEEALQKIMKQVREARIPSASLLSTGRESGVLLSLAPNPERQGKTIAEMACEIVKGKSLSSFSEIRPPENEFTVNMGEARQLGISIPADLLEKAVVIE